MKSAIQLSCLILCCHIVALNVCFSQEITPQPYGVISKEEIALFRCSYDSSADAVILFDRGEFSTHSFKIHRRVKFFNQNAMDKWGSIKIHYDKRVHNFSKFKASIYNFDKGILKEIVIGDDELVKAKYDKSTRQIIYTFPKLVPGSIIEYSFVISTIKYEITPHWEFQEGLPVLWSECELVNNSNSFQIFLQGTLPLKESEVKKKEKYGKWIMVNIPAFKTEPFISSSDQYKAQLQFYNTSSLSSALSAVTDEVRKQRLIDFADGMNVKDIVIKETKGLTDSLLRVERLYDFVKQNVAWNGELGVLPYQTLESLLESKSGSTAEINLLLVGLLREAGFESYPILLKTKSKGFINPSINTFTQLNDLICYVRLGNKVRFLDASIFELSMNSLPERCLNGIGLIVGKKEEDWIEVTSGRARRNMQAEVELDSSGNLLGQITIAHDGIYASEMRQSYKEDGQEKYLANVLSGKTWDVTSSAFENIDDYHHPAKETHTLTIREFGQVAGTNIFFNPIVYGHLEENPFLTEKRQFPVDFGSPFEHLFIGKITLPKDYTVEELPKAKIFVLPGGAGKYSYNVTSVGNSINVLSQFTINKNLFSPEEYPALREFYTQVVAKQNEQVVLKKKQ